MACYPSGKRNLVPSTAGSDVLMRVENCVPFSQRVADVSAKNPGLGEKSAWTSPKLSSTLVATVPSSWKSYHHMPFKKDVVGASSRV